MGINRIYKRNIMQQITGRRKSSLALVRAYGDTVKLIENANRERIKKNNKEAKS